VTDAEFALGREQRAEILKAVKAIERQLKEMAGKPQWQVAWVIGTNLAIIQAAVTGMPRVSSN
jgi:hypothetical protein